MGKIFKIQRFTTLTEGLILLVALAFIAVGLYWYLPGLRVAKSKQMSGIEVSKDNINNVVNADMLPLPGNSASTSVANNPLYRIAGYAWDCNGGMIAAIGGPRTKKGSLMEKDGLNMEWVRVDGVGDLRNMQIAFVEEFNRGVFPTGEKTAFAVSIMGDGGPYYAATLQQALDDKFGKGKYHVNIIAAIGMSVGEDSWITPAEWRNNPKLMAGSLTSSVIGDGDWVIAVNYAFANGIPVNPDPSTYDPDAVNFVPSPNDDYIESVKDLIKSDKEGYTVPLQIVKDGKLTGKSIDKKIDAATTWTPGDWNAFKALTGYTTLISTKEFNNQMPTTMIVIKEFAMAHEKDIINMLKNAYTAGNQFKLYDPWRKRTAAALAETFNYETPEYWYKTFKGIDTTKAGVPFHLGGGKVFNYADALQYYGITDGVNRYKAVYNQISNYLVELNPMGFNENVKGGVLPYEDVVNLYFLKSISDIDAGKIEKVDYTATRTEVMAEGEWHIIFNRGSAVINPSSYKDLETIYGLMIQAEHSKLDVIGHTDITGTPAGNMILSRERANSVVNYLVGRGIGRDRFQTIEGMGDTDPLVPNTTEDNMRKNRRVVIKFFK